MYSVVLALAVVSGTESNSGCRHRVVYSSPVVYRYPVVYYSPIVYSTPVVYPGRVLISERVIESPPVVTMTPPTEPEEQEKEPQKFEQTEADKRMLKELMEMVPDPAERKKVLEYWLAPGVDSKARKEFYDELLKKAKGKGE